MRARSNLAAALLLAMAAGALGCAAPVISIGVTVVTSACADALSADPQRDPMAGVDTLQFTLTGDDLSPVTITAPYTTQSAAAIPNVPLGTNRRIVVEALSSGLVRSRADSGNFDVTSSGDLQLTLYLRVVDAFVFTGSAGTTACSHLNTPRAGHQMTLLPDGRVLITGGFNIDGSGNLTYLTQAEIYDPSAGTFTPVGSLAAVGRAGHAAVPVAIGGLAEVLLFGGEGSVDGTIGPAGPFELYSAGGFSTVPLPTNAPARERAAMAVDLLTGYPVMLGGANGPDTASVTVYDQITYFDPSQNAAVEVDEPLAQPLSDAVGVSRQNLTPDGTTLQGGVVLVGGRDATGAASTEISGVLYDESEHTYTVDKSFETSPMSLPKPRVSHAAVVANDDSILVLGGTNTASDSYLLASDEVTVVDPATVTAADATQVLSVARADGCAVLLGSGEILYSGGAWGDSTGVYSTSSVDLITPSGTASTVRALEGPTPGGNWGLQAARHKAACLLLADGTVLVTGGLQFQSSSGMAYALGSAEIYTPPSSP